MLFLVLVVLAGCAVGRTPGRYAQAMDSATSGCLRSPACYTPMRGEEAIIPWLSRTAEVARTTTTVMRVLDAAQVGRIEAVVVQCARQANEDINKADEVLRGRGPEWEECKRVVRQERGREVTRAIELGEKKHVAAMACVRAELAKLFPDNISVEPRYQRDAETGAWMRLDPVQVAEWVQIGLTRRLRGSLVPDLVVHASGNPNQVQRVYDLKFRAPGKAWVRRM